LTTPGDFKEEVAMGTDAVNQGSEHGRRREGSLVPGRSVLRDPALDLHALIFAIFDWCRPVNAAPI
jgi:hypothetical protein